MRVVQRITAIAVTAIVGFSVLANGQSLVNSRSYSGGASLTISRGGTPTAQQFVGVQGSITPGIAQLAVIPPNGATFLTAYSVLEFPLGPASISLFFRTPGGGADASLPTLILMYAQATANGTSLFGFGSVNGIDAYGAFSGTLVLQLAETAGPPQPPQPPQPPNPTSGLPSFDGTTLRVPAAWNIRKFEGWAMRLAQKYGTLTGGTSANVPSAWQTGVMQCHGTEGFIYEIPLNTTYSGFINGMILYTPPGRWPSWESTARWQQVAATPQVTKYAYR